MTARGDAIAAAGVEARDALESTHQARELALTASRATIRSCAVAIRAVQRREFVAAREHIADAAEYLARTNEATAHHPDIGAAGFVHDAAKEFAEAHLTLAFVEGGPLPTAADLGVDTAPYLNGMAEAASELRRQVLDRLRADDVETAENLFALMDEVYGMLVTVDYPEAITGGLRRTTDALRAVLERTRGDVTNALVAARFRTAVEQTQRLD